MLSLPYLVMKRCSVYSEFLASIRDRYLVYFSKYICEFLQFISTKNAQFGGLKLWNSVF